MTRWRRLARPSRVRSRPTTTDRPHPGRRTELPANIDLRRAFTVKDESSPYQNDRSASSCPAIPTRVSSSLFFGESVREPLELASLPESRSFSNYASASSSTSGVDEKSGGILSIANRTQSAVPNARVSKSYPESIILLTKAGGHAKIYSQANIFPLPVPGAILLYQNARSASSRPAAAPLSSASRARSRPPRMSLASPAA